MDSYYIDLMLSIFFIMIPAVVGWIRFPQINPVFYPFLISIWLNALNVIFGSIIVQFGYYNIFHYNIWFLIDAFLLLWLFKKWNLFESKKVYYSLWVLLSVCWLAESIFLSKLTRDYNSYFRIFYSFLIVLLSISTINSLLMRERKPLIRNPIFIICCTFALYNTITVVAEAFFASHLQLGDSFRINMDFMILYAGFLFNTIYAIAILWMPKKQAFILQY